jgi:hypothetical protein
MNQIKFTFFISSGFSGMRIIVDKFKALGWTEISLDEIDKVSYIDFMYIDYLSRADRNIQHIKTKLKSIVRSMEMFNKYKLWIKLKDKTNDLFQNSLVDFIDKPLTLLDFPSDSIPQKYIVRPVQGYAGIGLFVSKNAIEIIDKIKEIRKIMIYNKPMIDPILVTDYIQNLMLYEGKIFHIRIHMIVARILGKFKSYAGKYIVVATGKEKFDPNVIDVNTYDSHFDSTGDDIIFPGTLQISKFEQELIMMQIYKMLLIISKTFHSEIKCYAESENCFEVCGIDVMITKEHKIKLLEVNNKTGLKTYTPEFEKLFFTSLFSDIIPEFINPIFYHTKGLAKPEFWKKIYEV